MVRRAARAEHFEDSYAVMGGDFTNAGRASTDIKDSLKEMGIPPDVLRRVAIAAYEAEMNVVMYARKGAVRLQVAPRRIVVEVQDEGPGIPDIELAMQEGYSTATPEMREMGFGAGMGLPNIQKNADQFTITSVVGQGTRLYIQVNLA